MTINVNTNVSAMTAQRYLTKATGELNTSMERLSSGNRINSAKDDAAGLQISNRLTAQSRGLMWQCVTPTMVFRLLKPQKVR